MLVCVLSVVAFVGLTHGTPAIVDFENVWGTLTLDQGDGQQEIECSVTNADPKGEFVWLIDGEPVKNRNQVQTISPTEYLQSFVVEPNLDMDGSKLTCQYIQRDLFDGQILYMDKVDVDIAIVVRRWPPSPYNAGLMKEGETGIIELPFSLYPAPESGDVKYMIREAASEELIELLPGQKDLKSRYHFMSLQKDGDTDYKATLKIGSLSMDDVANEIYILVAAKDAPDHRVDVTFSLSTSKKASMESNTRPNFVTDVAESGKDSSKLGIGIWIILAIIVLIIIICVIYCIWQKKCRKNHDPNPSRPEYEPAKQSDA